MRVLFIPTLDKKGLGIEAVELHAMAKTLELVTYLGPAMAEFHRIFTQNREEATSDFVMNNLVAMSYLTGEDALTYDLYIGVIPKLEGLTFDAIYTTNKALLDSQVAVINMYEEQGEWDLPPFFNHDDVTFEGTLEEIYADIQQRAINLPRST